MVDQPADRTVSMDVHEGVECRSARETTVASVMLDVPPHPTLNNTLSASRTWPSLAAVTCHNRTVLFFGVGSKTTETQKKHTDRPDVRTHRRDAAVLRQSKRLVYPEQPEAVSVGQSAKIVAVVAGAKCVIHRTVDEWFASSTGLFKSPIHLHLQFTGLAVSVCDNVDFSANQCTALIAVAGRCGVQVFSATSDGSDGDPNQFAGSGKFVEELQGHTCCALALSHCNNGTSGALLLAAVGLNGLVFIGRYSPMKQTFVNSIKSATNGLLDISSSSGVTTFRVTGLKFSSDGRKFALTLWNGTIYIFDCADGVSQKVMQSSDVDYTYPPSWPSPSPYSDSKHEFLLYRYNGKNAEGDCKINLHMISNNQKSKNDNGWTSCAQFTREGERIYGLVWVHGGVLTVSMRERIDPAEKHVSCHTSLTWSLLNDSGFERQNSESIARVLLSEHLLNRESMNGNGAVLLCTTPSARVFLDQEILNGLDATYNIEIIYDPRGTEKVTVKVRVPFVTRSMLLASVAPIEIIRNNKDIIVSASLSGISVLFQDIGYVWIYDEDKRKTDVNTHDEINDYIEESQCESMSNWLPVLFNEPCIGGGLRGHFLFILGISENMYLWHVSMRESLSQVGKLDLGLYGIRKDMRCIVPHISAGCDDEIVVLQPTGECHSVLTLIWIEIETKGISARSFNIHAQRRFHQQDSIIFCGSVSGVLVFHESFASGGDSFWACVPDSDIPSVFTLIPPPSGVEAFRLSSIVESNKKLFDVLESSRP